MPYRQVDVFADKPLSGNGLGVFWKCEGLSTKEMQALTIELRQFESIFLAATAIKNLFRARVFTMEEELDFAGHPVLGASAVLHEKHGTGPVETWSIQLRKHTIPVRTEKKADSYKATMIQPRPEFISRIESASFVADLLKSINLDSKDLYPDLPLEVVSTGLPYAIVPIQRNIEKAKVLVGNLEPMLKIYDAKFVYVYDIEHSEGRTWDNGGKIEDIATGSAAGPVAAYLCQHKLLGVGQELTINQGRFVGRPSHLQAKVLGTGLEIEAIEVSGNVRMVSASVLD
jgi:PhzF family phenazine biosynthesis protein